MSTEHDIEINNDAKNITKKEIDSNKTALTQDQIKQWCEKNVLSCLIIDLKEEYKPFEKIGFIYTGNEPNEVNNGITHHWIFKINNKLFDSYGKQPTSYNLPKDLSLLPNDPNQYQEFAPSSVCGEYSCLFYWLFTQLKKNKILSNQPTDEELEKYSDYFFPTYFNLTKNKKQNDKIILAQFNEGKNGLQYEQDGIETKENENKPKNSIDNEETKNEKASGETEQGDV